MAARSTGQKPRTAYGQSSLTWEEVSWALGKLKRRGFKGQPDRPDHVAQLLMRVLWGDERAKWPQLRASLMVPLTDLWNRQKWPMPRPGHMTRLLEAVWDEKTHKTPCKSCGDITGG